jgi:hypothetical protein
MMRRGEEWVILFTECGFILQTADLIEKSQVENRLGFFLAKKRAKGA